MEEIQAEKVYRHGKTDALLFSWPWGNLGVYKYFLYGPFLASVIYSRIWEGETHEKGYWCLHVLAICALRGLVYQLWSSHNNMLFNNRTQRLSHRGIDFEQIDSEWDWDNFLILQAMVGAVACLFFLPLMESLPIWNLKGVLFCLILHMGFSEPVYYWIHRFLHSDYMFLQFHWLHHSSKVTHPFTAGHATFMEHLLMCMIVGMPILGTLLAGLGSISMIYGYLLVFDSLRCLGHSNVEIVPHTIFRMFPFLRYCVYTPTYHSLHHENMSTNFCLFMPLYDVMWKTIHHQSWDLHEKMSTGSTGKHKINVPDFVFLAHIVDVSHALHSPFVFRSFGSTPCGFQPFIPFLWPICLIVLLAMWAKSNAFLISFYRLKGQLLQIWCVPRFGLQYFLPFAKEGINKQIEEAILKCDKIGVKVVSLAALNKNEALNGGGALYVERHPNLRVRVVHGNTLTAAVIINEIPKDVVEVFLVGSTSKLGRAIALYLARRHIRVMMLTQSNERFTKIQKEASEDCRGYLVQVTKYQAAQHCKTWIMGKWATPQEQQCAPKGTHFHQFVVPTIIPFRRDCTYGKLAAMSLPKNVEGLGTCEYELPRGVVHACHAGGVVHLLEGWNHHEVGAINVDQIDVVWNAAHKHGFKSF